MIVYRCLTSKEITGMINNTNDNKAALVKGENTFHYEQGVSYKHFFVFADHADYFREAHQKACPVIGQYVIPNDIIKETGFGFYGGVETMRNNGLFGWYAPLPEVIISTDDFKNDYLYKIESDLYSDFVTKRLDDEDNKKFNEPIEEEFLYDGRGKHGMCGYLDYSYGDVYYEMIYQLAKKNHMNMYKVAELLKNTDFHEEIQKYFEENAKLFERQTKKFLKRKKDKITF